ncbi:type I restriction endonuclease subunit R [Aliarcobacter butzleri]|uniref:type I restriction endonuclease subunit R n=1 Tax=Aliarcobacter butzleri TaxID=28197 RepID=UPI0021B1D6DE|nr:DEAD/DEAH box helicase family protein [Aliarcobacter butzleri]MCT7536732.1 DEAD/DEAH box helicase family protein [Aliarcobacter butzleri]MCT7624470.1 DEAD/DEAH box helicase family protein [Aliarcobacter butzleri]
MTEAQTRRDLIDIELNNCGWNVNDTLKVIQEYEIPLDENLPLHLDKARRFVDYALLNKTGQIIAIIEAKRENKSVDSAKTQAEYYAKRIKNIQGFAPFIYFTNGNEIKFWDCENGRPREVLSYHSLEDLETYRKRNENNIVLSPELFDKNIAGRAYQVEAITKTLETLNNKKREILWVMATGTGKTRTVISLVDILLKTGFVKRVLFLADRRELARQAMDNFKEHLPNQSRQRIETETFEKDKRLYVSTYQTMMSLLKNSDISQGFFDLIIADESHRSIYNYYGQLFLKFDALKLGLTATPIEFIDRDTYKFFGTQNGNPTFAYTYEQALQDGYLSPYEVMNVKTKFQIDGIRFKQLSKAEQENLRNSGFSEENINFEGSQIEKIVINDDTNRKILTTFMDNCYKHPITNLPAKTIIFAVSKAHANRLASLFDELFPQYNSKVAKVIVSELNNTEELIKEFKDENSGFNIAISVDMLDTGIDVPSIMNLVFAKPVFSRAKFWQMIGRGTRLYDEVFKKEKFLIFDFWGNFEYFNEKPEGFEPKEQISLNRKIFNENIQLLKTLQNEEFEYIKEEIKKQIEALPKDDYFIKSKKSLLSNINEDFYNNLKSNLLSLGNISELIDRIEVKEPQELQFRVKVKRLQNFKFKKDNKLIEKYINSILVDIESIRQKKDLTEIKNNLELLDICSNGKYWFKIDFNTTNEITDILAPLMKYKPKNEIKPAHFDLEDAISAISNIEINHPSINIKKYEENILKTIQSLINKSATLQKLFIGAPLEDEDLENLKNDMLSLGLSEEQLCIVFDCKSNDMVQILKNIINKKEYKLPFLLDKFIETHTLNSNQIEFIKAIKHYVIEKHNITRRDLMENPFTKYHKMGILGMFQGSLMNELVEIIDDKETAV